MTELAHCSAAAGAIFVLLPERVRQRAWAGLIYGVAALCPLEAVVAPSDFNFFLAEPGRF